VSGSPYSVLSLRGLLQMPSILSLNSVWLIFRFVQATLETFFGLGLIVGPTLGGLLYQYGGYMAPFTVLGTLLFAASLLTYAILPGCEYADIPTEGSLADNSLPVQQMAF
jgi:hypothetical protein